MKKSADMQRTFENLETRVNHNRPIHAVGAAIGTGICLSTPFVDYGAGDGYIQFAGLCLFAWNFRDGVGYLAGRARKYMNRKS